MSIPVSDRQRLACISPINLAGETLKRVAVAQDLLNPAVIWFPAAWSTG